MDNSGCVKYRKGNHTVDLFRTLHTFTHAHTEHILHNNVRLCSGKENRAKVTILLLTIIQWEAAYIYCLQHV